MQTFLFYNTEIGLPKLESGRWQELGCVSIGRAGCVTRKEGVGFIRWLAEVSSDLVEGERMRGIYESCLSINDHYDI